LKADHAVMQTSMTRTRLCRFTLSTWKLGYLHKSW